MTRDMKRPGNAVPADLSRILGLVRLFSRTHTPPLCQLPISVSTKDENINDVSIGGLNRLAGHPLSLKVGYVFRIITQQL